MANSKIGIIITREFNERVRKKSFIVTTILMPVLMIGLMVAPALIMRYSQGETRHISVIDESGVIAPRLESSEEVVYEPTDLTLDEARREHTDRFGILWIGGDIMTNPGNVKLYTNGSSAMLVEESVSGQIADIIEKEKLKDYNIENLSQILDEVKTTVYMQVFRNDQMQDDGSTHRNNVVEGYPVAEFFNKNGYNAFVLQRRVNPYAAVDQQLDLARAIRYIRHNASEKHIGKTDIMIAVGFSAGGMNVMQVVADQFGTTNTPDKVYPSYVCDAVDHESADLNVAIPIYGLFVTGLNFTKNPNLPPVFGVVGQKDGLSAMMLPSLPECANIFTDFSFYLAPDAPHGVGLGTGTKGYVDYYTQIAQWPDMAVNFIESRLGLMEKKIDMDSVGFAW